MNEFDTYPAGDFSGTNVANSFVVEANGRISLNSWGIKRPLFAEFCNSTLEILNLQKVLLLLARQDSYLSKTTYHPQRFFCSWFPCSTSHGSNKKSRNNKASVNPRFV